MTTNFITRKTLSYEVNIQSIILREERQEVYEKVRDMYDRKDKAREKFLNMHEYNRQKKSEISEKESLLEQLRQDYEPYKAQEDMNLLFGVLPKLSEHLKIVLLCKGIGLTKDAINGYSMENPYPLQASFIRPNTTKISVCRMPNCNCSGSRTIQTSFVFLLTGKISLTGSNRNIKR